jgi:hypothetical protein
MRTVDYPEDSFQSIAASGPWWETDDSKELIRGQLVWAHVQFFDEIPLQLLPVRAEDRSHGQAILRAEPLRAFQRHSEHEALPVAALPRRDGADGFVVNRAKRRPCLILAGVEPTRVTERDRRGQPNWSVAPFAVAAPYYSADRDSRAGYNPILVERIRHARYRQFFVDRLPVGSTSESILRFDQMFPVSHNSHSHERTGFRLSDNALALMDEWMDWFVTGDASQGELGVFRDLIASFSAP